MILLDTSIVIQLCRKSGELFHRLPPLDEVCVCGVTRAEILQGIRSDAEARYVTGLLSSFHHIPILEEIWGEIGFNLRNLRKAGITIPFPDAIIITLALHYDLQVWTTDRHFKMACRVLPELNLYRTWDE